MAMLLKSDRNKLVRSMVTGAVLAAATGVTANAEVVSAQSEGFGLQVEASVADLISVDVLELLPGQHSIGVAPSTYGETSPVLGLDVDASVGLGGLASLDLLVADGLLSSGVASDVDGSAGSRQTTAYGQVNGLSLDLADVQTPILDAPALLSLTADTLRADASITGDYGSFTAAGSSVIQNLALSVSRE